MVFHEGLPSARKMSLKNFQKIFYQNGTIKPIVSWWYSEGTFSQTLLCILKTEYKMI